MVERIISPARFICDQGIIDDIETKFLRPTAERRQLVRSEGLAFNQRFEAGANGIDAIAEAFGATVAFVAPCVIVQWLFNKLWGPPPTPSQKSDPPPSA